jgi:hypothetical protein
MFREKEKVASSRGAAGFRELSEADLRLVRFTHGAYMCRACVCARGREAVVPTGCWLLGRQLAAGCCWRHVPTKSSSWWFHFDAVNLPPACRPPATVPIAARVRPFFSGCGRRLVDTLEMLAEGRMGLEDLPTLTMISTVEGNGTELLFCLNNRRLWVMKQLLDQGFFAERTVGSCPRPGLSPRAPHRTASTTPRVCARARSLVEGGGVAGCCANRRPSCVVAVAVVVGCAEQPVRHRADQGAHQGGACARAAAVHERQLQPERQAHEGGERGRGCAGGW